MFQETPEFFEKAGGRRAFFGLFGKHRAWADHMDDLGMDSPTLVAFKKRLLFDGIKSVIDSGLWKNLSEDDRIEKWGHRILIHGQNGILLAQLWESRDQRGRREYPLVAAVHIATGQLPASMEPLWHIFDEIRELCLNAETQDDVHRAVDHAPGLIEQAMRQIRPMPSEGLPLAERNQFLTSSAMGDQEIGLSRFLYRVSVDLKDFLYGKSEAPEAKTFRLPLSSDMGSGALLAYLNLIRTQINEKYPVTLCEAIGTGYFDLCVGAPNEQFVADFKCSLNRVALVTDVAFNIPDEIQDRIRDVIGTFSAEPLSEVMQIADPGSKAKGRSFFGSIINRISNK